MSTPKPVAPVRRAAGGAARQTGRQRRGDKAARVGFVAKGLVYALIGSLAVQVALRRLGADRPERRPAGSRGEARRQRRPLADGARLRRGTPAWRFGEAAWGRRDETDEKKRTVKRLGSAANGLRLPRLRRPRVPHGDATRRVGQRSAVLDGQGARRCRVARRSSSSPGWSSSRIARRPDAARAEDRLREAPRHRRA